LSNVCLIGRYDCSTRRMISSFSNAGYLIRRLPHPRSHELREIIINANDFHLH
jgi:hypothetical protein